MRKSVIIGMCCCITMALGACTASAPAATRTPLFPTATSTTISTSTPAPIDERATPVVLPPAECEPTDQDRYVYSPARLNVYSACVHVTGVVKSFEANERDGDGDVVFDVALDAQYEQFIDEASRRLRQGYMHVEIVCAVPTVYDVGARVCAIDPDPLQGPYPSIGQHVWLEGRLVNDTWHGLWVELHPLYRWGLVK